MSPANSDVSSATNPHCQLHPQFTDGCPSCSRARAAFQPYQLAGKPEPPSRSFQNFGGSIILPEASLSGNDLVNFVAAEAAAETIVDLVVGALINF